MNIIEPNIAPLFTVQGRDITPSVLARFVLTQSFYNYIPLELNTMPRDEETYERRLERMFLETRTHLQSDGFDMATAGFMHEWFANLRELFYAYQYPQAFRHLIRDRAERAARDRDDSATVVGTV